MKLKLSADFIKQLQQDGVPKRTDYWDSDCPGLVLRATPNGALSFSIVYRNADGARRRYSLGKYPNLRLPAARIKAKKKLGKVVANDVDVAAEKKQRKKNLTLAEFLDKHYAPWLESNRKTGADIVAVLRSAFGALLKKKLSSMSAIDIERWRQKALKDGKSKSTCNRYVAYMRGMLSRALEWGYLEGSHPLKSVKQYKEDNSKIRYLSDAEEQRLMDALHARQDEQRQERSRYNEWRIKRHMEPMSDLSEAVYTDHLMPAVLVSIHTGLRRNELLSLEWRDIDPHNGTLHIRPEVSKSKQGRHVPMNSAVIQVLSDWKDSCTIDSKLVFPGKRGGKMGHVNTAWHGVLKVAKIKDFTWHCLRHTTASRLAMAGVDLQIIREILGHRDYATTLRYAHLSKQTISNAMERLVPVDNVVSIANAKG